MILAGQLHRCWGAFAALDDAHQIIGPKRHRKPEHFAVAEATTGAKRNVMAGDEML